MVSSLAWNAAVKLRGWWISHTPLLGVEHLEINPYDIFDFETSLINVSCLSQQLHFYWTILYLDFLMKGIKLSCFNVCLWFKSYHVGDEFGYNRVLFGRVKVAPASSNQHSLSILTNLGFKWSIYVGFLLSFVYFVNCKGVIRVLMMLINKLQGLMSGLQPLSFTLTLNVLV